MATPQLALVVRHIHRLAAGRSSPQRTDRELLDHFATNGDETAFAALVARHGPMVLRVCRRVLHHEQDAEDAFQATFLVLARSCGSIRKREALAEWLHGVAYRTAMKAKRSAVRRRIHEARLRAGIVEAVTRPSWDDVQAVLDEEIQRLPASYRAAFVLCLLEGKSGPEAAKELGVKEGTVRSRLNRARQRLQHQLARRGIELSVLLAAVSIADSGGKAGVPAELVRATVHSGLLIAAGGTAAGVIPSHVATLAAGVTRTMLLTKAKIIATTFLVVSLLIGSTGVLTHQVLAGKGLGPQAVTEPSGTVPRKPIAKKVATKPLVSPIQEQASDVVAFNGRVLGPSGQPVSAAKLYLTSIYGNVWRPTPSPVYGTAGTDGSFKFMVPKAIYNDGPAFVAATAPNFGAGWVKVRRGGTREDLTIRLVADDVSITGQIVDPEGKPVAGATLTVLQIKAAPADDLGPWLQAVNRHKNDTKGLEASCGNLEVKYLSWFTIGRYQVATDAAGRVRIAGIGPNRLVMAQLDGPGIVSQDLYILTRPGETIEAMEFPGTPGGLPRTIRSYYSSSFRYVAAPTKPIVSEVRDKDTKTPLAGITVRSYRLATSPLGGVDIVRTTTDTEGRYKLLGMPKGKGNAIQVIPPHDLPYAGATAPVPESPGLDPLTVDIELARGGWIEGRITDKVTGKPLPAGVSYFAVEARNGNAPPPLPRSGSYARANADGSYRILAYPGPGMIAVGALGNHFLRVSEREDEFGCKGLSDAEYPPYLRGSSCAALTRIDLAKGMASLKRNITLDPGWRLSGTVLGPDGKPLTGAMSFLLIGHWWDRQVTKTAEFTAWFNPYEHQEILFLHPKKGLVGKVQPPEVNGGSITVRMKPGTAVTGRLVDADGKPRAGVELNVKFQPKGWGSWFDYFPDPIHTDRQGRFRMQALLPGSTFRLSDGNRELPLDVALGSGQTKDLGDVLLKPQE
jgi:RNA polymerase sigma factor (sigma-70 family)